MLKKDIPYSLPHDISVKDGKQYYRNYIAVLTHRLRVCEEKLNELEGMNEKELINETKSETK